MFFWKYHSEILYLFFLSLSELGFLRKVSLLFWQAQIHFDKLINNFYCYSIFSTVKTLSYKQNMHVCIMMMMMMMITIIIIIIIIIK